MRHRMRGRKLGRNPSHRKAMFRNMACSLIRTVREYPDLSEKERLELGLGYKPKVAGRLVTTVAKAKQLRPFVEKLVTLARKAAEHEQRAEQHATDAERNSAEWKSWRESDEWNRWAEARAPAVALRRRAFAQLRDDEAVDILFDELAERFMDRPGGYTRVVRLASRRLGDAGQQAIIEFVGQRDRVRRKRQAPAVTEEEETAPAEPAEEEAAAGHSEEEPRQQEPDTSAGQDASAEAAETEPSQPQAEDRDTTEGG